jgi:hypothetical protein
MRSTASHRIRSGLRTASLGLMIAGPAAAQALVALPHGMPGAKFIAPYTTAERARVVQKTLGLASPPALGNSATLTPNTPYAPDGSHLSFWKPSFVVGTPNGGEAGINFWGLTVEGHINVGFMSIAGRQRLLDCRVLSEGGVTFKTYLGDRTTSAVESDVPVNEGHVLMTVESLKTNVPVSVELWPARKTEPLGFFGCDLNTIE